MPGVLPSIFDLDGTWNSPRYFCRCEAAPSDLEEDMEPHRPGTTCRRSQRVPPTQERSNMPIGLMPGSLPAAIASEVIPATIRFTAPPINVVLPAEDGCE